MQISRAAFAPLVALVAGCSGLVVAIDAIPTAIGHEFSHKTTTLPGVSMHVDANERPIRRVTYILGVPMEEEIKDPDPDVIEIIVAFSALEGPVKVSLEPGALLVGDAKRAPRIVRVLNHVAPNEKCLSRQFRDSPITNNWVDGMVGKGEWSCALVEFSDPGYRSTDTLELHLGALHIDDRLVHFPPISFKIGTQDIIER